MIVRTALRLAHKTKNSPQNYKLIKQTLFSAQALKKMPTTSQQIVAKHSAQLFMIAARSKFKPSMQLARYIHANPSLQEVFNSIKLSTKEISDKHSTLVAKIKNTINLNK